VDHHYWMQQALHLAQQGEAANEVPIGAVLIKDNEIIASAYNQPIALNDPCAHAEILVLREAGKKLNNYRLIDTTLYVTLEPCAMCAAAMIHARIKQLVFGAKDSRTGAAGSVMDLFGMAYWNHKVSVTNGVCEDESVKLLQDFFKKRRGK
jgi:tRNA(adenine34) deaminase